MGRLPKWAGLGAVALLIAAGGSYALASSTAGTITVCVSHKGGTLYQAHKCAKRDKRLSWNKVGPQGLQGQRGQQGPGATHLGFDGSGTSSPSPTSLGKMGPWSLAADCVQTGGTTTTTNVYLTGPGGHADIMQVDDSGTARAESADFPPLTNALTNSGIQSTSTTPTHLSLHTFWVPSSGAPIDTFWNLTSTGGATNKCHFSVVVIPTS